MALVHHVAMQLARGCMPSAAAVKFLLTAAAYTSYALQDLSEYDVNKAMDGHEGCNIYGWLDLQRVAGSLRISVHIEDFFQLARVSAELHVLLPMASTSHSRVQLPSEAPNTGSGGESGETIRPQQGTGMHRRLRSQSLRHYRTSWSTWMEECTQFRQSLLTLCIR